MEGLQGLIDVAFYALVGVALAVSGFFFVMGVFNFMSAGGDQMKTQQGITGMRNSIIGAVLIGGAGLIINFVVLDIIRPGGGEAGTLGQGLSCDQLLRQTLQTNPVSLANSDNVDLVVKEIQSREECPADSWDPAVSDTDEPTTDSVAGVSVPDSLCDLDMMATVRIGRAIQCVTLAATSSLSGPMITSPAIVLPRGCTRRPAARGGPSSLGLAVS